MRRSKQVGKRTNRTGCVKRIGIFESLIDTSPMLHIKAGGTIPVLLSNMLQGASVVVQRRATGMQDNNLSIKNAHEVHVQRLPIHGQMPN